MRLVLALFLVPITACTSAPDQIVLQLAPDVVSSIDGSVSVHAIVLADREPAPDEQVTLSVAYTDRNGTAHDIAPFAGTTDDRGAIDATFEGLTWDGTGAVTASVGDTLTKVATFAVLDRTPPVLAITPPPAASVRRGADLRVAVHVTDEIGVSEVVFESSGNGLGQNSRDRRATVTTGAADTTVEFDLTVSDTLTVGSTFQLYALAADLSGNQQAAAPITLTVAP